jgi:hypothetical protein
MLSLGILKCYKALAAIRKWSSTAEAEAMQHVHSHADQCFMTKPRATAGHSAGASATLFWISQDGETMPQSHPSKQFNQLHLRSPTFPFIKACSRKSPHLHIWLPPSNSSDSHVGNWMPYEHLPACCLREEQVQEARLLQAAASIQLVIHGGGRKSDWVGEI